jgi:hypothetical protein
VARAQTGGPAPLRLRLRPTSGVQDQSVRDGSQNRAACCENRLRPARLHPSRQGHRSGDHLVHLWTRRARVARPVHIAQYWLRWLGRSQR